MVLLPLEAPWLAEFRRELQGFPRGRYDDQVDSFSQFLNWSIGPGFWRSLDRDHPLRRERRSLLGRRRRCHRHPRGPAPLHARRGTDQRRWHARLKA